MERREQYDPEDIEQLLLDRPFDELLEEERAYVLRHLSGRAEYDAMRALLLTVHHNEGEHELMDAEPVVRERVLNIFRAQQKPQWNIWLNSVQAFLLPKDASAFWKPALAFASLAAVVSVCVVGSRSLSDKAPEALADLKQVKEVPKAPNAPVQLHETLTRTSTGDQAKDQQEINGGLAEESNTNDLENAEQPAAKMDLYKTPNGTGTADDNWATRKQNEGATATAHDLQNMERPSPEAAPMTAGSVSRSSDSIAVARDEDVHSVTKKELAANFTLTNAATSGANKAVAAKDKAELDVLAEQRVSERSRKQNDAFADDAALVSLLRAAW